MGRINLLLLGSICLGHAFLMLLSWIEMADIEMADMAPHAIAFPSQPTQGRWWLSMGAGLFVGSLGWGYGWAIAAVAATASPSPPEGGLTVAADPVPDTTTSLSTDRFLSPPSPISITKEDGTAASTHESLHPQELAPPPAEIAPSDEPSPPPPTDLSPAATPDPNYTAPLPLPDATRPSSPVLPPLRQDIPPFGNTVRPPFPGIRQTPDFDTYRLGPGDAIFVNVRQFPDLSFQATLDLQGNILVPLQGVTSLNGLTLEETGNLIRQIYNQYVIEPDVSLTLIAQRGVEVTILGEVVRPGYYPLSAPQVAAALLSAGGTTGEADLRAVQIQRRLPNGELLERTVDLFTPLKEGQEIPDVPLQDGDVIMVERLDPAELDDYDRALVSRSTLAQPVITVRLLNYGSGSLGGATSGRLTAIELPNGSRFADALVRASLNPDTSNLGDIALVRFDEEAGQAITTTLDGNEAFRGVPSENPPLLDNDVIIVDRTLLAKVTYTLSTFTQPFRDILGFLLFFDQLADSTESLFGP